MSDRPKRDAKGKVNKRPKAASRSTRDSSGARGHSGRSQRRGSRQPQPTHDPAAAGVMTANSHGGSAPTDHVAVAYAPTLTASTEFHSSVSGMPAASAADHSSVGMQKAYGSADVASSQEHTTPRPYHQLYTELESLPGYEEEVDYHPNVATIPPDDELQTECARLALEVGELFENFRPPPVEDSEHPQQ